MLGVGLPQGAVDRGCLTAAVLEKLLGLSAEQRPGHSFLIHVRQSQRSQSTRNAAMATGGAAASSGAAAGAQVLSDGALCELNLEGNFPSQSEYWERVQRKLKFAYLFGCTAITQE